MFKRNFVNAVLPLLVLGFSGNEAHAANVICRGGNVGIYSRAIKNEVASQLVSQNVDFSAVVVSIKAQDRKASKQTFTPDFSTAVTVASSPLGVQFDGILPNASTCSIPADVRIRILKGNATILDQTFPTTINGTLLSVP